MALLPARNVLDGTVVPPTTTGQMKSALGSLRDFLSDLLGTDSTNKAAALASLGAISGQWVPSGVVPTYTNTTTFTLPANQVAEFHAGRRLQMALNSGFVYGSIVSSVFTTVTTVVVRLDLTSVLDSTLSAVNLSVLRSDHPAAPLGLSPIFSKTISSSTGQIDIPIDLGVYSALSVSYNSLTPVASAETLCLRVFVGGVVQAGNIYWHSNVNYTGPGGVGSGGSASADTLGYLSPLGAVSNAAGAGVSGNLLLTNTDSSTGIKLVTWDGNYYNTGSIYVGNNGSIQVLTNSIISGIRLFYSTGNTASGTYTVYGLRKAV